MADRGGNGGSARGGVALVVALLILSSAYAAPTYILDPQASSGFDGDTWQGNLHELIQDGLAFNTVQTFQKDGNTLLWVPWFDTSTACAEGNLKTYGSGSCSSGNTLNNNLMVTDEFSEVMMVLAAGNASHESYFDAGYNTIQELGGMSSWGSLPYWIVCRDDSTLMDESGADTASDATYRLVLSLYLASTNEDFSSGNRAKYKALANTLIADSLTYEIVQQTESTSFGDVDYWLFGGRDAANSGISPVDDGVDVWTGYQPDAILAFIAACEQTGQQTYCDIAEDIVLNVLVAADYSGGTAGSDFTVAPFNYAWDNTGDMTIFECVDCNSYHFQPGNPAWDDSDAPRYLALGHTLRAWDLSQGGLSSAFTSLNDYMTAWHASGTLTATQSCLQYNTDGTCSGSITGGLYKNSLAAGAHTYQQTSTLDDKIGEAMNHYSFSTGTYDGSSCGNGLMYRGVRLTKALIWATGADTPVFNQTAPPPAQDISFASSSPSENPTIDEPADRSFSYSLNNPSGLPTTTTWYLDGSPTGDTDASYTFLGDYTSSGTYDVSVTIASSRNMIQQDWTLTVQDVEAPSPAATATGGGGGGAPTSPAVEAPAPITVTIAEKISAYFDGADMTAEEIVDELREYFGVTQ